MKKLDKYELEIIKMDHFGRGIGYIEDAIVFVSNALVGEKVLVEITYVKKNIAEAKVIEYITKSNKRIIPSCPYASVCGGCDIMHLSYNDQLIYKQNKVKEIIDKYLGIDVTINPIVSDCSTNYRNKVTFEVKEKIGLYKKKSYQIIPIDSCLIADKRINEILNIFKKNNLKNIYKVVIRVSYKESLVNIFTYNDIDTKLLNDLKDIDVICITNKNFVKFKSNKSKIIEKMNNFLFYISPLSFFQVNTKVATKMYEKVLEYANLTGIENVLDLYCGTGSIGIFLSSLSKSVIGIEINKDSIKNANENKELNKVDNISFIEDDVSEAIKKIDSKVDLIVVDPPRAGLDKTTIEYIIKFNPKKVIYVSCDPMTLARDLKILNEYYNINELTPFDMFPNTYHVECVTVLNKKI